MIKVEAIVRPHMIEPVQAALQDIGIMGTTVTEVHGSGNQKGYTQHYRGTEYTVNLIHKVKIETVVPDAKAEEVIEAILGAAYTGEIGDGKIFISPVMEAVRIRTKERGEDAI
jgi:nitrogen regulatory protein P-II 1